MQAEGALYGAGGRAPVHDLRRDSLCAPPVRFMRLSGPETRVVGPARFIGLGLEIGVAGVGRRARHELL